MLDFSEWAAMWDAYNRMGEAVSGSPQVYAKASA